jgi:hypothetical protein
MMRNLLGLGFILAAVSGCAGAPPASSTSPTSSTQGTTLVRSAQVMEVLAPLEPGKPQRLALRYDDGGAAVIDAPADAGWRAGDRVKVSRSRGVLTIERLDKAADAGKL